MIGNSSTHHLVEDRQTRYGQPFLASHRALAACARELARLGDDVARGVAALGGPASTAKAAVRRSPERCIVQLGPVALTVAWLQGSRDAVAAGELLVIVWRGAVAPSRPRHQPEERPAAGPAPLGATPLWEQVLAAAGDSEQTWAWQPQGGTGGGEDDGADNELGRCSSAELAARCVARLGAAYRVEVEREAPVADDRAAADAADVA